MEKSFTLKDLQYYLLEIRLMEKSSSDKMQHASGPGRQVIQNLLCYSGALNVLKTSAVGNIFQLTN
jgi:hypothetical protein